MRKVMRMTNEQQHCCYEQRFADLEKDVAELKARMDNKKDDIHDINKELANDRQQQIQLIEKVTEVTVLLKAGQEQREANNKKIDALEKKVDDLHQELADTKQELTDFVASQRSFRSTMVIGVPIAISIIVGIVFHFI